MHVANGPQWMLTTGPKRLKFNESEQRKIREVVAILDAARDRLNSAIGEPGEERDCCELDFAWSGLVSFVDGEMSDGIDLE